MTFSGRLPCHSSKPHEQCLPSISLHRCIFWTKRRENILAAADSTADTEAPSQDESMQYDGLSINDDEEIRYKVCVLYR